MADVDLAQPEGMDGTESGRWKAYRGHMARASSAGR